MKKNKKLIFKKRDIFKTEKEVYVVLSFEKEQFTVIGVFSKLKLAKARAVEFISLDFDDEKLVEASCQWRILGHAQTLTAKNSNQVIYIVPQLFEKN